jgi:transposase-like protein
MILGRVILAPPERRELQRRARGRSLSVESVRRAKVMLMLAGGSSYSEICARLGCTDRYISLWKERFQQERLGGLDSRLPWSRVLVGRRRPRLVFWS